VDARLTDRGQANLHSPAVEPAEGNARLAWRSVAFPGRLYRAKCLRTSQLAWHGTAVRVLPVQTLVARPAYGVKTRS
jgi:hypothetical protein